MAYSRLYLNALDAMHFGAMFSIKPDSTVFGHVVLHRDMDTGAENWMWPSSKQYCAGIIEPIGRVNMPFGSYAYDVSYIRALQSIVCRTEGGWDAMKRFELVCWSKPCTSSILSRMWTTGDVS